MILQSVPCSDFTEHRVPTRHCLRLNPLPLEGRTPSCVSAPLLMGTEFLLPCGCGEWCCSERLCTRLHTSGPGSVCPGAGLLAQEVISYLHYEEPAQDSAAPGHGSEVTKQSDGRPARGAQSPQVGKPQPARPSRAPPV